MTRWITLLALVAGFAALLSGCASAPPLQDDFDPRPTPVRIAAFEQADHPDRRDLPEHRPPAGATLETMIAANDSPVALIDDEMPGLSLPDSLVPVTAPERTAIEQDLQILDTAQVQRWVDHFTGAGRGFMQTWLTRKAACDSLIYSRLDAAGLPRELIWLAAIESGFNPRARSSAGAVGCWQFMAGTARHFKLQCDWWVDERHDLELATSAAATYLSQLYRMFGDWTLVIAAYNTGEHRIERAIQAAGHDDVRRLRMPDQTRNHVLKFAAALQIGRDPAAYGFEVPDAPDLTFDTVPVQDATDVSLIAECAGVDRDAVAALNPGLLRGATPPERSDFRVRVPRGTGERCERELAAVPPEKRLTWRRHTVGRGETLSQIATHYGTRVRDIADLNKIRDVSRIHPGDRLLIPMPGARAPRDPDRTVAKATPAPAPASPPPAVAAATAKSGGYTPPDGYERVSYRVKSGDTLFEIARRLGVTLKHIISVNGLRASSVIHPGQRLHAYRPFP
ncbi:MAG: LysM peptidoglycan-binding domain-containing protein [bacterium]|nr:LysM peptidoglycan-binding domain-containing protein [bacterium]